MRNFKIQRRNSANNNNNIFQRHQGPECPKACKEKLRQDYEKLKTQVVFIV